jgi:hypothetical protein
LDTDAFLQMDSRDEAQIVRELMGEYIDEYVYSFDAGGKKVVGVSWAGIEEASRQYGGIKVRIVERNENDEHIECIIEATDSRTGSVRLGIACQAKVEKLRDGKTRPDPFARQKVMAKAQRNAIRALLPQQLLKAWVMAKRQGKPLPHVTREVIAEVEDAEPIATVPTTTTSDAPPKPFLDEAERKAIGAEFRKRYGAEAGNVAHKVLGKARAETNDDLVVLREYLASETAAANDDAKEGE